MTSADWLRLLPPSGHRHRMGLHPGSARLFWTDQDAAGKLGQERRRWLEATPERYRAAMPEAGRPLLEARAWIARYSAVSEADWVLLSDGRESEAVVLGGEVALPSSWSLPEKLGLPLPLVHGPVPGLEAALGRQIGHFLGRIQPDSAWERENWGLSADAEMNHHPAMMRPRLGKEAELAKTWLRLERQFLTRLPETGCLLFGIRISVHRLDALVQDHAVAAGLLHALRGMEPDVAEYKGLTHARPALVRALERILADVC